MKSIPRPSSLLRHDDNLPWIEVEKRAGEIAEIEDRTAPTAANRMQAEQELNGEFLPPTVGEDETTMDSLSRGPNDPPAHHGRQIPDRETEDEPNQREKLVSEGVEEAQHDQMLAARRKRSS